MQTPKSYAAVPARVAAAVGYLSLGLWTATAFSPTGICTMKPWASQLMLRGPEKNRAGISGSALAVEIRTLEAVLRR